MKRIIILSLMAAVLLTGCKKCPAQEPVRKMPVGVQLYSVRTDLAQDFYGTLKKVSEMGYQGVEFYGEYYGHTPTEVKRMCAELGLIPFSNHVPFDQLMNDIDKVIEENTIIGVQYLVFPYMDTPSRPGVDPEKFKETVARIAEAGTRVNEAGFILLYHNHDFEFAPLPDGTPGHDFIFDTTPGDLVQMELDVCWADFAGFNPAERIVKYAGRIPVVHMKDYYLEGKLSGDPYALIGIDSSNATESEGKFEFRPLGEGVVDIPAVIKAAAESGARWLCVEQDEPTAADEGDRFAGIARSAQYLREKGLL